jgi:hypothetical protein
MEEVKTLRRRIDDDMAQTLKEYRDRISSISERLTRIDESLTNLKTDFMVGREARLTIQEYQTSIVERLAGLSSRFILHIEEETTERILLQEMTKQLSVHNERLKGLDRLGVSIWSVIGTMSIGVVAWIINHITTTVR